ncbi:hypothetical protein F5Y19DRAFT_418139 [Xylariaceae sp. FL1651]|nr:hypothetical protein F5Y19DRAFT_418139 [Xylariaceae sp. FL1651]
MARLLSIPFEVLLQITSYITTPEYGFLRRACKHIEASLFGTFAREFFSKRQFALTEFSIKALVDISRSRLGPSLTHLIIHLEHPRTTAWDSVAVGPIFPSEVERAVAQNRFQAECISHFEFIHTGLDVEMLSDALKNLPNLETIGMRDFSTNSRSRDNTAWHSYGCPTLRRETRTGLATPANPASFSHRTDGCWPEYTCHVFLTILRAIGNVNASKCNPNLTRLEVLLHTCRFPDQAFKIPERLDTSISSALCKLKTIYLDGLNRDQPFFMVDDPAAPVAGCGYFLSRFLMKSPAIENLRLNFQGYYEVGTDRFLSWLAGIPDTTGAANRSKDESPPVLPSHFPPTPEFSNLQCLEIGMATVKPSTLLSLYRKYKPTLRGVSLHKITLLASPKTKTNHWHRLCNDMANAGLDLTMVRLSHIKQDLTSSNHYCSGDIIFKGSTNQHVKVWRGAAFSQAVKDITDGMKVSWHNDDEVGDFDSGDEGDDSEVNGLYDNIDDDEEEEEEEEEEEQEQELVNMDG